MNLELIVLPEKLAVYQLPHYSPIPDWTRKSSFLSITRTEDELSIVCEEHIVPDDAKSEKEWRGIKVAGPLDFALVGILANLSGVLAKAGVSIFAISTYDTDYILIKNHQLDEAVRALRQAGHHVNF